MEKNVQDELVDRLTSQLRKLSNQQEKNIKSLINDLYTQLESFSWLQKGLAIKGILPPLRGWPVSPDFLLRLHRWIRKHKPQLVVETGSGASTLVIADALRQNGTGALISFEHLKKYGDQTWQTLVDEELTQWVDLRVGELVLWDKEHLNPEDADKPSRWYPLNFDNINDIDLLVVDGPPEGTCRYARYPAVPALFDRFTTNTEIWMDDAKRQDEKDICERWAKLYNLDFEFIPLEKGLARLTRSGASPQRNVPVSQPPIVGQDDSVKPEHALGLDFSLPEERHSR
ncbi:class I SAM-dependent methyltransferase [Vreelandella alkaliphila]|uniref:class I SAM-dependent methyltransferase n=1 Tax=Vreelandella alkaliphila TaxID=272774 RepID=UPI003FD8A0E0